jgi:hypothetical protein
MAEKTIRELQAELQGISEKTKDAYDALNGRDGLYRKLGLAQNTLEKKGLLAGAKERAKAAIPELEAQIKAAEIKYNKFQTEKNSINKAIKDLKKAEETGKLKEATAKGAGNVYQKSLDELKKAELGLEGYKGETKYQDAWRKAEAAYANAVSSGLTPIALGTPKIQVPPVEVKTDSGKKGTEDTKTDDLSAFISTLADPANANILKAVQQDLARNFNYTGPIDGKYSLPFQNAIATIAKSRSSLPEALRGKDFRTFIADSNSSQLLGTTATGAGGGSGGTSVTNYISDATAAASTVNSVIKSLLGRDATPKEVKDLSTILIDAQKKNPYRTTNGIRTGGIDDIQVITDVIRTGKYDADKKLGKLDTLNKLSTELSTKKADKRALLGEDLLATAKANGITLNPSQLEAYTQEIQNGKDIGTIKSQIRNSASLGYPDSVKQLIAQGTDLETIYSPYRARMASILEMDPAAIDLNDPTLRMAIGPDKEMTLYDFQRQLRKDNRWQYTNNARAEAADVTTTVLKNFGFMG